MIRDRTDVMFAVVAYGSGVLFAALIVFVLVVLFSRPDFCQTQPVTSATSDSLRRSSTCQTPTPSPKG